MTRESYTYRSDPSVPRFDDSAPLIIFDGHCMLCLRNVSLAHNVMAAEAAIHASFREQF